MEWSTFLPRLSGFASASGAGVVTGADSVVTGSIAVGVAGATFTMYSMSLVAPVGLLADLAFAVGRVGAAVLVDAADLAAGAGESEKIDAIPASASDQLLRVM